MVQIAAGAGLAKRGTIALDGSKVKANASTHKAMSYERMQEEERRLTREIRELTRKARSLDEIEDERCGPDFRGDELPVEIKRRQSRLEKIREARRQLEARKRAESERAGSQERRNKRKKRSEKPEKSRGRPRIHPAGKPQPKDQQNFTDPDSRIMKVGSKGFEQCHKTQIALDASQQVIVATGVTQKACDVQELVQVIDQVEANTGQQPEKVLADAGYRSEANFAELEQRGIKGFIPLGREGKDARGSSTDAATCRMARRMRGARGRSTYKMRKRIVEPVFGWIKHVVGFRSFSLRGLRKVRGEWSLVCLALNLKRLNAIMAWK